MRWLFALAALAPVVLVGCSSDSSDSAAAAEPRAPTIKTIEPMAGGLHVFWTNNTQSCDAIEGERKSATEPYGRAFTVPDGSVDNKHDAPQNPSLVAGRPYTYRLRCKKGSAYSPYSAEASATP